MSCRRAIACAAALAALALPGAAPAQAPPEHDFVGMNTSKSDLLTGGFDKRRAVMDEMAGTRVQIVRVPFDWSRIEDSPGHFQWVDYDNLVVAAALHGLRVLPTLDAPPKWRSTAPSDDDYDAVMYPPKSNREMAYFAFRVAHRYGPHGEMWREKPGVPKLPIESWQVWNEPNIPAWWGRHPDPARYTDMLGQVGSAIRSLDPNAEIVTAGLTYSPLGQTAPEFLEHMYADGAMGKFDTLALHPYSKDDSTIAALVGDARDVLARHGDDARIRVTEFGWATGDPRRQYFHTEAEQARRIANTIRTLGAMRTQLRIRGLDYFYWREPRPQPATADDHWSHVGLIDYRSRHKPGFFAFRDAVADLLGGRIQPSVAPYVPTPVGLKRLRVAPKRVVPVRGAKAAARTVVRGAKARPPGRRRGADVTFKATRTGAVTLEIQVLRRGDWATKGSIPLTAYEGRNRLRLSGSLRGRPLRRGRYRLTLADARGLGTPARARFRIVKRHRHARHHGA